MSKSQHGLDDEQPQQDKNNQMSSDDPGDGNRESFVAGKDGTGPAEKKPAQDRQDQSTIEAFGEGAGIAAKE